MNTANSSTNRQVILIEEAETELRIAAKEGYMRGKSAVAIRADAARIIRQCVDSLRIPDLKDAAQRSLWAFFNTQLNTLRSFLPPYKLMTVWALLRIRDGREALAPPTFTKSRAEMFISSRRDEGNFLQEGFDVVSNTGNALNEYSKTYIEERVQPVFDRLAKQFPLDPDDRRGIDGVIKHANSLRNRAEMEVRYEANQSSIEKLRQEGHRLVICSTHADCSKRCRPWQGRVYSLDGTYGYTDDGRKYVPLEEATDVYYTTKAGKTYKNGLLGFNCRHYLVPYKSGYRFPRTSEAYERRQYAITQRQRALERNVREWRTKAIEYKGGDRKKYEGARKKAIEWNRRYIDYSKRNGRAYYPSRTKIL